MDTGNTSSFRTDSVISSPFICDFLAFFLFFYVFPALQAVTNFFLLLLVAYTISVCFPAICGVLGTVLYCDLAVLVLDPIYVYILCQNLLIYFCYYISGSFSKCSYHRTRSRFCDSPMYPKFMRLHLRITLDENLSVRNWCVSYNI